ncbi:MAG: ribonuclease III [bacterium]|nr:ribonuclease III [bacterium]
MDSSKLEKEIGVEFKNKNLLKEALTHRSYLNENPSWGQHNERMEFLGDSVLELITSDFLYKKYPGRNEGDLTVLRAALINYQMLAQVAREIDLENYILLSKGEAKDTGKGREAILADAFEALLAAIYLDRGYEIAEGFILKFLLPHLEEIEKKQLYRDPKSFLQEMIQEQSKVTPTYQVLEESGPDHQKIFRVGVYVNEKLIAEGKGLSKQEAEVNAAGQALSSL